MGKQPGTPLKCFTLRLDEVELLAMYRRLTLPDRDAVRGKLAQVVAARGQQPITARAGGPA